MNTAAVILLVFLALTIGVAVGFFLAVNQPKPARHSAKTLQTLPKRTYGTIFDEMLDTLYIKDDKPELRKSLLKIKYGVTQDNQA